MSSLETTSSFPERDRWDGLERLLASYSLTELFEAARQHPSPLVTNELQIRIRSKYDSKLGEWDNNSSARSKPRRLLTETEERGKFYFPPELVPFCSHPDLLEIDPDITSRLGCCLAASKSSVSESSLARKQHPGVAFITNWEPLQVVNHMKFQI